MDGGRRRYGFGRAAEARRWTAQVLVVVMVMAVVPVARATPAAADVPANDSFAGALSLSGPLPIRISGSVAEATKEPGEPDHAGQPGGHSVWYGWTPDTSGVVSIDTCVGTFDSLLGVYTGEAVEALTQVVSNDDGCALQSKVSFHAVAGTTYRIAVDSYGGSDTAFGLAIEPSAAPANDAFASAETLAGPLPIQVSSTNVNASKEPGEPDHAGQPGGHSVWYSWTADAPGQVVVNTCTSNFNTLLAVYTGDAIGALTLVVQNDNAVGCEQNGGPSQVQYEATPGQTYRIAIDGSFERTGTIALTIRVANSPPNDHFAEAQVIDGPLPLVVDGTNVEATKEPGEPNHQGSAGGRSVWYQWTPPSTGFVALDTCSSNFTPVMAVYTGDAVDALTPVAVGHRTANCGPGPQGGAATLVFEAIAGRTYSIAIDGSFDVARLITLRIRAAAPPANDDFADAEIITGPLPIEGDGVSYDATKETGEPNHANNAGGASVWYEWTADATGRVSIDTCGSTFDTVLAVYTGDALDALVPVASNRDSPTCLDSRVVFIATAGTAYRIAVDGYDGSSGHLSLAVRSVDAPANDAFEDAHELTGALPITHSGSSDNASKEPGEPNHAGNPGGASVWFRWTPTTSSPVVIETCASSSIDTLLAVYTGDAVGALVPVASNAYAAADDCGSGFESRVRVEAVAGLTYRIAVDGRNGDTGTVGLTVRHLAPPANDDFADAQVLPASLPIAVNSSNLDATKEPGEPDHGGNVGGASIWYRWTPDFTAPVVVDACGGRASLVGVYTGTAVDALTPVGGEDGCGGARFTAVAGTTYSVGVDGYGGRTSDVFLRVRPLPLNDDFADAQVLEGALPLTATADSRDATTEPFEPNHGGAYSSTSVWYRWTADDEDPVVVDLCGSAFDTRVSVYTGAAVNQLTEIVGNDDACGVQSRVTLAPTAGETYHIAVGADRWGGPVALTLREPNRPANDDFADAQELGGVLPITVRGTTADATAEPGEPAHAGFAARSSVWYKWTPTFSGPVTVTSCGTRFDSLLGVYTGDRVDALTAVVSDDDGCGAGGPSRVALEVVAGETYSLAVDGWEGATGLIELAVRIPPRNDDFVGAQVLTGTLPVTVRGTSVDSTAEPGEHRHAGYRARSSVWYSWTPTESRQITVDTCGSAIDTALAVYTGSAVHALTEVGSNDNGNGGHGCGFLQSEVVFDAVAGTTYLLAIETGMDAGMVQVRITTGEASGPPPANDDLAHAEHLGSVLPAESMGSNTGASAEAGEPDHAGVPAGGSVWYRWTAAASAPVVVETCGSGFDTTLGVYTGQTPDTLTPVAASYDSCGAQSRVTFTAAAGTTYLVAVDGFFGDRGSIVLRIRNRDTPPNDQFADAATLDAPLPLEVTGSNLDATRQSGEPWNGGASVWYSWQPTVSETVVIDACHPGWAAPRLAVYTGTRVDALARVPGTETSPFECDGDAHTRLVLPVTAGTAYRIVIDGSLEAAQPFTMTIRRAQSPANDDFAHAQELIAGRRGLPIEVRGSNVDAALEPGEPGYFAGGASVWYRWTAATSGRTTIETCGSDVDTSLAVYTGASFNRLQSVQRNENSCGPQGGVTLSALAGETYRIAVDGRFGDTGDIRLTIRTADPPANDDFADAQTLSGELPIRVAGTTVDASRESGEMPHGYGYGGASVWYRYTPTTSNLVVVDVCDSDFGPQLAVYRGALLYPIEEVGFAVGGCTVTFFAAAGETYRIAVDGEDGAAGDLQLELRVLPPNDDIGDATILPSALSVKTTGDNREATMQPGEPDHAGRAGGASIWHRWTPTTSHRVVIDTCGSGIATLLGVYTGIAVNRLTEVASDAGSCGGRSRLEIDAVAGETYWIAIDGADGATGRLRLSIAPVRRGVA